MLPEVIHTVHKLAAICKMYREIVFTYKNGNFINDNSTTESDNSEITGVNGHEATYDDLMGIYNISNHSNTGNMIGVDDYSKDTSKNTRNMTGGIQ